MSGGSDERLSAASREPHRLGRFVILDRLGRGGMGIVYSAYDPVLDRRVALKLLRPGAGQDVERMRARLQREAQALARLSHPNVVPVYDVGTLGDDVFIVMEFVVGQTLRAWAQGRPWHEVLAAYLQAARGLAAAHAAGLVHRDVKPDNIMVGEDGRVRVLDFGLVRDSEITADPGAARGGAAAEAVAAGAGDVTAELAGQDTLELDPAGADAGWARPMGQAAEMGRIRARLTATHTIMGTPAYMAPEQLAGAGIGPQSDQFGFCVALYEAMYGQLPFDRRAVAARLAEARATGALAPAEDASAGFPEPHEPPASSSVPAGLWPIVRRALSADPARRWPGMEALVEELSKTLARFDRDLADSGLHRFHWLANVTLSVIAVAVLAVSIYADLSGLAADMFTPRASLMSAIGTSVAGAAFLVYARMRWARVTYLRHLTAMMVVPLWGMLGAHLVGIWVGASLYQIVLDSLVTIVAVYLLGSLMFARWAAWLALLNLASLLLCVLFPEHCFVFFTGTGVPTGAVALVTWQRHLRRLGARAAR